MNTASHVNHKALRLVRPGANLRRLCERGPITFARSFLIMPSPLLLKDIRSSPRALKDRSQNTSTMAPSKLKQDVLPEVLAPDFLRTPATDIAVSRIDFAKTSLPEYKDLYAVVLDNVMTQVECDLLIQAAEATTSQGWERAMVNIGGGRQAMYEDTRKCGRIIWDSQTIIDRVWARIEQIPDVQEIMKLQDRPKVTGTGPARRGDTWAFSRPNERMRFLKYIGGEYFRPHQDGSYETPDKKVSHRPMAHWL